jgi:large subunit ribosomal protein L17
MRHRVADKKFNRDANNRKALFTGLLRNLTEHGEIVTTLAKAKAVKRLADRMVSQAQTNTVSTRRTLHKRFGKRDVVSTLVERVAPAMADRKSGFVTITALGPRRGDNTPMAKLAFVKKAEVKGLKNVRVAAPKAEKVVKAEKVTKPAAKAAPKRSTKKAEKAA